jgi:hypothetical protein
MYFRRLNNASDWKDPARTFLSARATNGLVFGDSLSPEKLAALLFAGGDGSGNGNGNDVDDRSSSSSKQENMQRKDEGNKKKKMFTFGVVRHPLARFFSAFQNKIVEAETPAWREGFGVSRGVGVEEFIMKMTAMPPEDVDVHFRPQYLVCGLESTAMARAVSFLGRYEALNVAWNRLQRHLGRSPLDPLPSREMTTVANRATGGAARCKEEAARLKGGEAWARLVEFYKRDLQLLQYNEDSCE